MDPNLIEITSTRHNAGIDPGLHFWGHEVAIYLFLGGVVAGLMVLLASLELVHGRGPRDRAGRLAPFLGAGLLGIGMFALLLDLSYPMHVLRFFMAWVPTAPMSSGGYIVSIAFPILLALGIGNLDAATVPAPLGSLVGLARTYRKEVLWASVLWGVLLGAYTGVLVGTLPARPTWNSGLFGPLFLTSGISTGAALLLLLGVDKEMDSSLLRWDTAAIGVELALIAMLFIHFLTSGATGLAAVEPLLGGEWTPIFWGLVVVAGLITPLALNLAELRQHLAPTWAAPALVLFGGAILRWVLVEVGQETSLHTLAQLITPLHH